MLVNRLLFPLDLQFFAQADGAGGGAGDGAGADNQTGGQNQDQAQGQGSNNNNQGHDQQQKNDDSSKNEHMIPKSRFDEINNQYKQLKEQLDEINKQKEQQELEDKKKKGEFEELYQTTQQELENTKTEYQKTSERVEQLEGIIQTLVDAELEAVPEELQDLIPENYTPEEKLNWITQAKKKGLFGTVESKEDQELGGATNHNQQTQVDVSKMSVAEMLKSAYGKK